MVLCRLYRYYDLIMILAHESLDHMRLNHEENSINNFLKSSKNLRTMSLPSLTPQCQWHRRACHCNLNDTVESDSTVQWFSHMLLEIETIFKNALAYCCIHKQKESSGGIYSLFHTNNLEDNKDNVHVQSLSGAQQCLWHFTLTVSSALRLASVSYQFPLL